MNTLVKVNKKIFIHSAAPVPVARHNQGFTLIELLVVIAIIGLLSSVVMVSTTNARYRARYSRALQDMAQLGKAVEMTTSGSSAGYPADVGPDTLPTEMTPYLAKWPKPPCAGWTYDYENWSAGTDIRITMRRVDGAEVYHYCIYSITGTCVPDITNLGVKMLTCNE